MTGVRRLAGGFLLFLTACGGEGGAPVEAPPAAPEVAVVESTAPAWPAGEGWRIGEAALQVGSEDDPLFGVVAAARRPGGGVMVAEDAGGRVRFFDAQGRLEAEVGGSGDGPGEFRILQAAGLLAGDTAWAWDFALGRITVLHPEGGVVRVRSLEPAPLRGLLRPGPSGEGWLVVQAWGDPPAGAHETGVRRDPVAVLRYGADGILRDTLSVLPGREIRVTVEDGRGVMGPAPFGRNAVTGAWGEGVVVGDQSQRSLTVLDTGGEALRVVRWGGASLEVSASDAERWRSAVTRDRPPGERERAMRDLEAAPVPDRRPAYGDVLQDRAGHLWVSAWPLPGEAPDSWDVLAPDGVWLGTVETPASFRLLEAGNDWVLGIETDDLGVERVVLRRLVRRGARP